MIPGQVIAPEQFTDPGVKFASVHGLTPVTVHMRFSLPRGNFERWVTRYTTPGKCLFTWTRDSELPRGNDCPGASLTSRSHDNLLSRGNIALGQLYCPRATLPWVNLIAPGQVHSSSDHHKIIWISLFFKQIVTENEF